MRYSLQEIAKAIGAELAGADTKAELNGVASIALAGANDLVFVEDNKLLEAAVKSKAGAVIAPSDTKALDSDKPLLLSKSPKLSFVRAAKLLADPAEHQLGVHSTAIVHKDAKIALGVSIGPYATIGKNSSIGARTRIGANVHIAANVSIGGQCAIGANVTIYSGTAIHERVMIHAGSVLGSDGFGFVRDPATGGYEKFPQIGKLEILDDVEIGANCTVDRGALESTIIGRGAKLDNLVHVGHNVRIGENVVIAAQTGISGSSVIGDNVLVGGQVGIADHVTVEDGAILGAQCGIPTGKAIRGKGVVFWGTPARPLKQHLKELAALARLVKKGEKSSK